MRRGSGRTTAGPLAAAWYRLATAGLPRAVAGTLGVKVASLALALLASLVYARTLGPRGYGVYAYVMAWSTFLAVPASLGFQYYLVREGAVAHDALSGIRRWADRRILLAGLLSAALMAGMATIPLAGGARALFLLGSPLPLITSLVVVRQSLLQAQGDFVASQAAQMLLAPGTALCILVGLWIARGDLTPAQVAVTVVIGALLPLVALDVRLRRFRPALASAGQPRLSLRQSLPFMWLGLIYLLNSRVDLFMLGALRGAASTGIYAVASRIAELVGIVLITVNGVIAPTIARLYREGDLQTLQRLVSRASAWIGLLTLPVALVLTVWPGPLLRILYGPAFGAAADTMRILVVGQAFNVLAGPTGMLLNMTGNERLSALGVGASLLTNVVLNAVLIPLYGPRGAATATAASMVLWNVLLFYWVRKRLGLRPGAIRI